MKSFLGAKPRSPTTVVNPMQDNRRILTEYVLNMAVSCLAGTDVTPLYEQYMEDPRLSEDDREELARAFLLLQMASVASGASEESAIDSA
jgi:hypothetical protein